VHLAGLVADSYTHWGPSDLLVPLATSWRPGATALGIVAAYLLVAIEGTSLAMKRIPKRVWRAVHMTSFGLYVVATGHLLTAGTDRHNPLLLGVVVASTLAVVFGTVYRIAGRRPRRTLPARQTAVTRAPQHASHLSRTSRPSSSASCHRA
jgi:DMSO/TMAO reductase YedYZ heme-binding membrane subunit